MTALGTGLILSPTLFPSPARGTRRRWRLTRDVSRGPHRGAAVDEQGLTGDHPRCRAAQVRNGVRDVGGEDRHLQALALGDQLAVLLRHRLRGDLRRDETGCDA